MRICVLLTFIGTVFSAILGLDYGQQFTKAVLLAPGVPFEIVLTDEGKRKDLSGISIRSSKEGELERVYGSSTGSLCTRFPKSCLNEIKPLLGKSIHDRAAREYLDWHFGVKLIGDESRSNSIKFDMGFSNKSYEFSVEEILAMNLNEIKSRALADLDNNPIAVPLVEDVVISIPPFATQETRQAYIDSLHLANFSNVLGLVEDGTAVAVNYLSNKNIEVFNNEKVYHIVYDMGAGSTTATLFSYTPYSNKSIVLEIHNVGYDENFGGKLLTNSIHTIILEKVLMHFNLKHSQLTDKILARVMEVAEKAKIILSANNEYHVSLESIYEEKDFKAIITRSEFEEINSDLMYRITEPIMKSLGDISLNQVESVILNGGSTRVPFVKNHLISLLGENKIAKTVNADESCALGTTFMGLKLKTNLERSNEIKVIDNSFHNYQIILNESDEEKVIFSHGERVDNIKTINAGTFEDKVTVDLYEDDRLFKSYILTDLNDKSKKLTCATKELLLSFKLDHNKLFDLADISIECTPENPGFLKKLLKQEKQDNEESEIKDEEEIKNGTNSTDTRSSSKKVTRPISVPIPKAIYSHIKPIQKTPLRKSLEKLSYLNAKDDEKIQLDYVRNILEGQCYELRSYVDEYEEVLSAESISAEDYFSFITETIEWLEFESDESSVEEFRKKISELNSKKSTLDKIIRMHQSDLSQESLANIYENGSSILMTLQNKMLDFGIAISEFRKKFEDQGFDFDKENNRIKSVLFSKGEDTIMNFERNMVGFKEELAKLEEIINISEKQFSKLTKEQLFEVSDSILNKMELMLNDLSLIENSHNERVGLFEKKYNTLIDRKLQKEFREKLKQEKESLKAQSTTEILESSASGEVNSETPEEIEEDKSDENSERIHDEL